MAAKKKKEIWQKKVFTSGEVAALCRVASRTVSKWFDSGRLKGYRIPGSQDRRFLREEVIRFIQDNNLPMLELEKGLGYRVLLVGLPIAIVINLQGTFNAATECCCVGASTYFEAGRVVDNFRPDMVVINFAIGRGDALIMAKSLLTSPSRTGQQLIAIACEDEAEPNLLLKQGFGKVLQAPLDQAALVELIHQYAQKVKVI